MVWTDALSQGAYSALIRRGVSELAGHVVVEVPEDPEMHLLVQDRGAIEDQIRSPRPMRVTSRILVQGLLQSTRNTSGVALVGIDPERETAVSVAHQLVEDGDEPGMAETRRPPRRCLAQNSPTRSRSRSGTRSS